MKTHSSGNVKTGEFLMPFSCRIARTNLRVDEIQQLVPGLVEASEKKTALEDKMTELSGKLETVEIPDMTALKAQLGAGAEQVFDGAANGAAKAASEAAASNAAKAASQKTAEEIKGNVQAASSSEDVTNARSPYGTALSGRLFQQVIRLQKLVWRWL